MALDRTFDDGRVQTANVGISSSTVSEIIMDHLMFMFTSKRFLYFRYFRLDEAAAIGVYYQRGRRKTAELDTSGAKRAETWQGGVKWEELAIGLAVASGGGTQTGEAGPSS